MATSPEYREPELGGLAPQKTDQKPVSTIMDKVLARAVANFDAAVLSDPGPIVYDNRMGLRVGK